jgi:Domain of unknown function (DUF5658)
MNPPLPPNPEVAQQAEVATRAGFGGMDGERRVRVERRKRIWWSLVYGGFHPRRRRPPRREADVRIHVLDWHGAHLWAASVSILILSVVDAFLTVMLMSGGAVEVNPIMAVFVGRNVAVFAGFKMAITGISVMVMVYLARYRFMRLVRVDVILYCILLAYATLVVHEVGMLRRLVAAHLV